MLGVYEGVTQQDIVDYVLSHPTIKIVTTYDSLPRVIDALSLCDVDAYNECFLLIDEYHSLFNAYSFRNKAIRKLLDIAPRFQNVTYISATPTEQEYVLEELKHLPIVKVEWEDMDIINLRSRQTNKPLNYAATLCRTAIDRDINGNLHFFINTVEGIAAIIQKSKLTPEQVKIVASVSGDSKAKNEMKLGAGFEIGSPSDPPRKINFYTMTCFEGCDIFDKQGRIFIVSDGAKSHTLLDISTLFIQICGRIRDTMY